MNYTEMLERLTQAARIMAPLMDSARAIAALVRNIKADHVPTTGPDGEPMTSDEMRQLIERDAVAAMQAWHQDDDVDIHGDGEGAGVAGAVDTPNDKPADKPAKKTK